VAKKAVKKNRGEWDVSGRGGDRKKKECPLSRLVQEGNSKGQKGTVLERRDKGKRGNPRSGERKFREGSRLKRERTVHKKEI